MSRRRKHCKISMEITNGDILVSFLKINAVTNSGTVILGDAKCLSPRAVSFTRGVSPASVFAPIGPGGPTGATGVTR